MDAVDDLRHQRLAATVVEAPDLADQLGPFGDYVDRPTPGDDPHVDGPLPLDAPVADRGDRAAGGEDRAAPLLGADAGVGGGAAEARFEAEVAGRVDDHLADRGGVVEAER